MNFSAPLLVTARREAGLKAKELAEKIGISAGYLSELETGKKPLSEELLKKIAGIIGKPVSFFLASPVIGETQSASIKSNLHPTPIPISWLPVISWVHAGEAASYEELPLDSQEHIPVPEVKGRAFVLRIQGDSMEPRCLNGDCVVVLPDREAQTGNLVVAKFKKDGVVLRRYTLTSKARIRLTPYNSFYEATEHSPSEFHWIYPVQSTIRTE